MRPGWEEVPKNNSRGKVTQKAPVSQTSESAGISCFVEVKCISLISPFLSCLLEHHFPLFSGYNYLRKQYQIERGEKIILNLRYLKDVLIG